MLKLYPHNKDPEYQFTSLVSDFRIICPTDDLALSMSRYFKSPVYRYVITSSPSNPVNHHGYVKKHAYRGWDLLAFFGTMPHYIEWLSKDDEKFAKNLRKAVFQFARDGRIAEWEKYPAACAIVDSDINFTRKYHRKECQFWKDKGFYPKYAWIN